MFNSLAKRNENPLTVWRKEMNQFFDRFNREFTDLPQMDLMDISPKVEVKDEAHGYLVKAEMPGLTEKDIKVSLRDNCLILEGERKSEMEKESKNRYFSEFSYGSFYRSIPFDAEVKSDDVKATYKNGVLTVRLAKDETAKSAPKSIPVLLS